MDTGTIVLTVSAEHAARASALASELQDRLAQSVSDISIERKKNSSETLDAGTIMVAVLGTRFAVELARVLHAWLLRNHSASVSIGPDGKVDARGLTFDQLHELVRDALTAKQGKL